MDGRYLVTAGHNVYDSRWSRLVGMTVTCRSSEGGIVQSTLTRDDIERTREDGHYVRTFATDYAFLKLPEPLPVENDAVLNRDVPLEEI